MIDEERAVIAAAVAFTFAENAFWSTSANDDLSAAIVARHIRRSEATDHLKIVVQAYLKTLRSSSPSILWHHETDT